VGKARHSVLGIRHHGPGSARSVVRALEALQPDAVLIEGPPDADALLPLLGDPELVPPVALMVYSATDPARSCFYPFCDWSPEFQAIRWALENERPVQFMDLPQTYVLRAENELMRSAPGVDALGELARAAGYASGDGWWEDQVEMRRDDRALFEAILLAMDAVRQEFDKLRPEDAYEAKREAHMRKTMRAALRKHEHIAVVCGAFHAPALDQLKTFKVGEDAALLKGLKKERLACTWVPWAASRLSLSSGYGAGMQAPAWYQAIWESGRRADSALSTQSAGGADVFGSRKEPLGEDLGQGHSTGQSQIVGPEGSTEPQRIALPENWLGQTARLLRAQGLELSSAHVIEGVRLAEALAALRGRSRAGLEELREATRTVLLSGDDRAMALVRQELEVGDALGAVPESVPTLPLQKDVEALIKKSSLIRATAPQNKELDLRKPKHKATSLMLYRLQRIGIGWGACQGSGGMGSFKEIWTLKWDPGYAVQVVASSTLGNTLQAAATQALARDAQALEHLGELAELVDQAILAELPTAGLLQVLDDKAAVASDIQALMSALPPLAKLLRYGSVRQAPTEQIRPVLERLFERVVVGLPGACVQVDAALAGALVEHLDDCHGALALMGRPEMQADWSELLLGLQDAEEVHPLIRGRAARKRLEAEALTSSGLTTLAKQALNQVVEPLDAAWWLEGLLKGSGLVLVHQKALWEVLDQWLSTLNEDTFIALLPMLRRSFSSFDTVTRRRMRTQLTQGPKVQKTDAMNTERAGQILPVLQHILTGAPHV
jgi:hypothetical protein